MKLFPKKILSAFLTLIPVLLAAGENGLTLKGSGWYDVGRIMHSSDTLRPLPNYNGNWFESFGAHFTTVAKISEHWEGAMGIGGFQTNTAQSTVNNVRETQKIFVPLITQAQFTYNLRAEDSPFQLTLGYFPYLYNHNIQNLGAYLLRGPVYPGLLFSEFESKDIDPNLANTLGILSRFRLNGWTLDLMLKSETDLPPIFDLSVASVLQFHTESFQIGAGVNFHRLVALNEEVTDLTAYELIDSTWGDSSTWNHPYYITYAYHNTLTNETVYFTHRGVKLMGMATFDPKPLLGLNSLSDNDLKLYSEVAVIGVENQWPVYTDISERIPVVVGFNMPTFNLLDAITFELEWYGAKFKDDYSRILTSVSPIPVSNENNSYNRFADSLGRWTDDSTVILIDPFDVTNMVKDNWKWSLYLAKNIQHHVRLSFQIANDHFRPNGHATSNTVRRDAAFTILKDYYFKFRMGYFF